MGLLHKRDATTQGTVGLGVAVALYSSRGDVVMQPLVDAQPYDLVIDEGNTGRLQKVQIKTTRYRKDGKYEVKLNTASKNKVKPFDRTKVDYVFILTELGDVYIIPSEKIGGTSKICLGKKYEEYNIGRYSLPFTDRKNTSMQSRNVALGALFEDEV